MTSHDGTWVTAGEGILNWTARTANCGLIPSPHLRVLRKQSGRNRTHAGGWI